MGLGVEVAASKATDRSDWTDPGQIVNPAKASEAPMVENEKIRDIRFV